MSMKACIVIPVLDEETQLGACIDRVHEMLVRFWGGSFSIVIADNGSTDATPTIAARLARKYPQVEVLRLDRKGRGGALRTAWLRSSAEVLAYMDVDLSTDLAHLPELLGAIVQGGCDVAIGSRHLPGSRVERNLKRETLSRVYNGLVRGVLGLRIRDAQCGFKALNRKAALRLLPEVRNDRWFFDTELLARAQWLGFQIREFPVRWVHDPDSRVKLVSTIAEDLRGLVRLRWDRMQFGRMTSVKPVSVKKQT
jgi:glycosyltransferase involved in cell wall biosynthesis